ncbi:hypothetical protein JCM33774_24260 [Actinophytocola sp. KF-1]
MVKRPRHLSERVVVQHQAAIGQEVSVVRLTEGMQGIGVVDEAAVGGLREDQRLDPSGCRRPPARDRSTFQPPVNLSKQSWAWLPIGKVPPGFMTYSYATTCRYSK